MASVSDCRGRPDHREEEVPDGASRLDAPRSGINLVMCAEDNETGPAAVLLLASLRRLSAPWGEANVFCFSPRRGHEPHGSVRSALVGMGAELVNEPLNERWVDLPHSNKVLAAAWVEQRSASGETIAVVDSDTIFTADPQLTIAPGTAAVAPVWLAGLASEGDDDPLEVLWQVAESSAALQRRAGFITPLLERKDIRPYYNSGLVVVRAGDLVLGTWRETYTRLLADDRFRGIVDLLSTSETNYARATAYLDQVALALALSTVEVDPLAPLYNCPIHYLDMIEEPWRSVIPKRVVHVHHLKYLCSATSRKEIFGRIADGAVLESQLLQHLDNLPIQVVTWPPTFAPWFQTVTDQWRKALSIAGA
jgi:hypothetical protein